MSFEETDSEMEICMQKVSNAIEIITCKGMHTAHESNSDSDSAQVQTGATRILDACALRKGDQA